MDATKIVSPEEAQKVVGILQTAGTQKLITAAGLLAVLLVASHFIVKLFKRFLNSSKLINKSLHTLLTYILRYMLILLSLMVAANSVGVPITTFVALFSILGVALSLALQGVLSNIAGCLILVTGRQFGVGDFIQTPTGSGTVKDIGLLYTELGAPDGTTVYLPNSSLYTAPLTNVTSSGKRRIAQVYTAAYRHAPDAMSGRRCRRLFPSSPPCCRIPLRTSWWTVTPAPMSTTRCSAGRPQGITGPPCRS